MAYDPVKRAAREAAFRAEHGVSSGTYYEMRTKAKDLGISPKAFDKISSAKGYGSAKEFVKDVRDNPIPTGDGGLGAVVDYYDDYFGTEIDFDPGDFWYH